jgi:hypothetical protein
VEFDLKTGKRDVLRAKGTLVLGEGDKLRIDCVGSLGSGTRVESAPRIGDGTKVHTGFAREKPSTEDSPKGIGKALRSLLARPGVLLDFDAITSKMEVSRTAKASDFTLGAKEKVGDIVARVLEFKVLVKGRIDKGTGRRMVFLRAGPNMGFPLEGTAKIPVTLWIDTETKLPVKLEIRWAPAVVKGYHEFTETLRFTINGKLDEKLFKPPK